MSGRLQAFAAVFRASSAAADVESLPGYVMEALVTAVPSERAELVWSHKGAARLAYARGLPGAVIGSAAPADSAPLHALAAKSGRSVTDRDAPATDGPAALREPYAVAVPLVARGRVVGTLLLARRAGSYGGEEVDCLVAVGHHLGLALEHARLTARLGSRAQSDQASSSQRTAGARSRWLTALGEVAAGVAHDLNNALHPVITFLDLAMARADDPELVRAYVAKALLAARDGAEIVRRIQRFTRRGEGPSIELVELARIVGEVVELTRATWGERTEGGAIDVVQDIQPGLAVAVNPGELRQALLNLVSNAVDAMSEGGILRFIGRADADRVLLAVQDTGCGMSHEVLRRAAEPFFTTKGMLGTGLGLSEVYGIARRHAGTVELESWPGAGTTVLLRLPAEEPAARPAPQTQAPRQRGAPARILLVDDSVLGLEAVAAGLRAAGHEVVTAASGSLALDAFEPGRFDVVLTDIGMNDMCGWELLDRVRELDAGVRLGVLTGWPVAENDPELADRSLDLVLQKPIDPDTLVRLLEEIPV